MQNTQLLTTIILFITLLPACRPNLAPVPNPVSDNATRSKKLDESVVSTNQLRNLYFGDLHVHTKLSVDAYVGGTLASPDDAYRFAKGQEIEIFGRKVKIGRPLDFTAVTDHSEMLGEMYSVQTPGSPGHNGFLARYIRSIYNTDSELGVDTNKQKKLFNKGLKRADKDHPKHPGFFAGYETTKSAWEIELKAAEDNYEPGKFTTLAGYEWTFGGGYTHQHRNIIFRDMVVPDYPMSSLELRDEEALWKWLQRITEQGATVLAIPHNTNLSNGGTFTETQPDGSPYDRAYAQLRQDFEPLVEVHQIKGNSEVTAAIWKNDEFAGFENYSPHPPKKNDYVRYALERGLQHEENLGVNPFKYGMIGSTDTHNGTPGNAEEDDEYIGNGAVMDLFPKSRRYREWALDTDVKIYEVTNPGGLVAVWAKANTRGHIYDALKRKETYATSGTRIRLRFFCGYGFEGGYISHEMMLKDGYDKGVPMGSDIPLKKGQTPEFLIWAAKDPEGANLDRIQVIKGWYKDGEIQEKIFNVALSDKRELNPDGSVPDNGATVNMETGEWSKDKGDADLMVLWKDPEFDKDARAFYYVRVLQVPTASWRLWDQIRYGIPYPEDADLVIRERAWSSPVWYSPR